jgi:hypothetical protein
MLASSYVGYGRTRLELAPGGRAGSTDAPDLARVVLLDDGRLQVGQQLLSVEAAATALHEVTDVRLSPAPGVALQTLLTAWEALKAQGVRVQLAESAS